jgi:hypothetical protein
MMTYRVRRKLISTTFKVNQQLCKVFLEPWNIDQHGHTVWNVGFAVGKSRRQLNDWYNKRKNKRWRSIHEQITGTAGLKTIARGFKEVLRLRWQIEPGDVLLLDCTSKNPEQQFRAWQFFQRKREDWLLNEELLEFYWRRPPYPDDIAWNKEKVIPQIPSDLYCVVSQQNYQDCFYTV